MTQAGVTAIIPAFNEEQTIGNVVRTLVASPYIHEVIVVSDGSSDKTKERALEAGARVYEFSVNRGKGQSMLYALTQTNTQIVAFFDADLVGLTQVHIEQLVLPVMEGKRVMNIGLRDRGRFITFVTTYLPLIGGERVLQRFVMEGINPKFLQGYMIESSLNYFCRAYQHVYGSVVLSGLSIRHKYEKVGVFKGVLEYIGMYYQVLHAMFAVRMAHLRGHF